MVASEWFTVVFNINSDLINFSAATLLLICGGEIEDIKTFLLEERVPDGWSSKMRKRFGLTMVSFNAVVMRILLGIDPSWKRVQKVDRLL